MINCSKDLLETISLQILNKLKSIEMEEMRWYLKLILNKMLKGVQFHDYMIFSSCLRITWKIFLFPDCPSKKWGKIWLKL